MSARFLGPEAAVEVLADRVRKLWPNLVTAWLHGEPFPVIECRLCPGIDGATAVHKAGVGAWDAWRAAWRGTSLTALDGVECLSAVISIAEVPYTFPRTLRVTALTATIDLLVRSGKADLAYEIRRAQELGRRMLDAGVSVDATILRRICRLRDFDVSVLFEALEWLRRHDDLAGWTSRQLPVPRMHTKWLDSHEKHVRLVSDRRVLDETKERPAVIHFTYTDPAYRQEGLRRHDAWTIGDAQALAYTPTAVVIVENRDCRMSFPETADTIVVEGEGKAASTLACIDWILGAERVFYWGDLDGDGFGILDNLRRHLGERGVHIESILMDGAAWSRYRHLGVDRDKDGRLLPPSTAHLGGLTRGEQDCYALLGTAGPVDVRRIEQERIPIEDAAAELSRLLSAPGQGPALTATTLASD